MRLIVRIEHIEHEGARYYRMGDLDGNAYRWEKLSDCHQIFIAEDDEFKALEIAYRECLLSTLPNHSGIKEVRCHDNPTTGSLPQ